MNVDKRENKLMTETVGIVNLEERRVELLRQFDGIVMRRDNWLVVEVLSTVSIGLDISEGIFTDREEVLVVDDGIR